MIPSPVSVRKPPRFRGKSWEASPTTYSSEPLFPGLSWDARDLTFCLPCRRSRVRIPSAASEKARICRLFLWAQSACASASGRTDSGLAAGRSSAGPIKTPCLQVDSGSSEPKSFCGPAERSGVRPAAAVTPTPAATARSCGQRPPARYQRSRSLWAQSGFSPKPGGQPRPAPRPRRAMTPRARGSPQDGVSEAAARPHHRELVSRQSHGGHRRGCRFPSASRHLRAPGLLVVVHRGRHSTRLRDARLSRIAIVRQTRKRGARLPLPDGLSASTRVP
jgi:hypothetical protein